MASIKQLDERRYKITVSNGYRPNGKKISKAKTIQVPPSVPKRGIGQYVAHAAEELERSFKTGYAEDGEMTFQEFASRWLTRQTKYAPSTIAAYRRHTGGGVSHDRRHPHVQTATDGAGKYALRAPQAQAPAESPSANPPCSSISLPSPPCSATPSAMRSSRKNPARMIDLPTPRRTVQRIPTRSEAKLLDALPKEPRHYRLFYLLSMYTGCRRGELCALQWSDFRTAKRSSAHRQPLPQQRSRQGHRGWQHQKRQEP